MAVFFVSVFYVCWLVLTFIGQPIFKWSQWVRKYDIFRLVPGWTFFAPNPGVTDYNLLARFRLADGTVMPFEEIALRSPKKISIALFNPRRRMQKALHDHAQSIVMQIENDVTEENKENIKLTFSYISVLNYCSKLPAMPNAAAIQFIILESFGYQELEESKLILNSEFHRL